MTASMRKELVVGLGATGMSVARYLQRNDADAIFFDTRREPPGLDEVRKLFPDTDVLLGDADLPANVGRVIASPGVPDRQPLLRDAYEHNLEVVSDIELFAREVTAPFVAVTGSNGKSTVTTLIYHMCRAAGRKTLAGGNLGEPALDLLTRPIPDIYVLELSSFQLQRTESLPAAVAVLLNVSADHLDWHTDEREYADAKYRIYREALAAVIFRGDERAQEAAAHCDRVLSFGADEPGEGDFGIRNVDGIDYLVRGETLLLAVHELAMVGGHNRLNALAALATGELLGLEMAAMLQVLAEFPGLPHRMQFVARIHGVDYINDSKATNVAAAVASVRSIDSKLVLIAGGDSKDADFAELAAALTDKLRAAVLIGKEAENIAAALDSMVPVHFASSMQAAVSLAAANAERDDTVLLAPACASFDMFQSFIDRGEQFCVAVREMQR